MDDFDIEMVDLRTGTRRLHLSESKLQEGDSLDRAVSGCYWPRHCIIRRALVSAALLAGILLVFLRASSLLTALTGNPIKATSDSTAHIVLFTHSVPWGVLSIDGHHVANINDLSFVSLPAGSHELIYDAAPFPVLRCSIHVPELSVDTCPLYRPLQGDPHFGETRRIIDLGSILRRLPSMQKESFQVAAQAALDEAASKASIVPGEHYVSSSGRVAITDQPISIELKYEVTKDFDVLGSQMFGGESCTQDCASSEQYTHAWFVRIPVVPQWGYTLPTGEKVAMPSPGSSINHESVTTVLYVRWSGSWKIELPLDSTIGPSTTICALAERDASQLATSNLAFGEGMSIASTPAQTPAAGCVVTVTLTSESSTEAQAHLLFRFGVFLAANRVAHMVFPVLPVASSQETMFVNNLLQHPQ